jgi:uncharacterized membrane protein
VLCPDQQGCGGAAHLPSLALLALGLLLLLAGINGSASSCSSSKLRSHLKVTGLSSGLVRLMVMAMALCTGQVTLMAPISGGSLART